MYGHILRFSGVFLSQNSTEAGMENKNTYEIVHKSRRSAKTLPESEQKVRQLRKNQFPTN